jgi:glyoxylase-like metal-dependent hydrolase (beta-lactamase superfamily II)
MTRFAVLVTLVAGGALSITVAAFQQPAANAPKVVTVDKVKDRLWVLRGEGGGGNVAVFETAKGIVVVDAKNPGWGQPILDKIKELSSKPVTVLINTHTHGDHVSGNVDFAATVDIVTQENTKANMEKMDVFKQSGGKGLPKRTFKDKMSIMSGADQIDLYYFGPGHTNGDAIIVFNALRAAHTGDLFAGKSLPLVDGNNGGSVMRYPETVTKVYNGITNVDTVITGHAPTTMTWADVKEFASFTQDFLTWAQAALKAGKTPEAAATEWKVPERYQGYSSQVSQLMGGLPGRLRLLQEEMKK